MTEREVAADGRRVHEASGAASRLSPAHPRSRVSSPRRKAGRRDDLAHRCAAPVAHLHPLPTALPRTGSPGRTGTLGAHGSRGPGDSTSHRVAPVINDRAGCAGERTMSLTTRTNWQQRIWRLMGPRDSGNRRAGPACWTLPPSGLSETLAATVLG